MKPDVERIMKEAGLSLDELKLFLDEEVQKRGAHTWTPPKGLVDDLIKCAKQWKKERKPSVYDSWTTEELMAEGKRRGLI